MLGCPSETAKAEEIAIKKTAEATIEAGSSEIIMGRRHLYGGSGTTLNTVTPCAACKLLRRRCSEECPFSPYFSPHEPHKFAAVHKVFGASNVSKMLMEVAESQRADAANSLVYEANLRLRDPVYGCMGAISALQQQVQSLQAELNAVRSEILKYKYREVAASHMISGALVSSSSVVEDQPIISADSSQQQQQQQPLPHHHHHHHPPKPLLSSSLASASVNVLSSLSSSSDPSSSVYTTPKSSTNISHGSISSTENNVPYFV